MRQLLVVGLSHRTTPLKIRERIAIPESEIGNELAKLRSASDAIEEALMISTCNRFEIYASSAQPARAAHTIQKYFSERLSNDDMENLLYRHEGNATAKHAFRVASSLDSMVVGEPQILGQLKDAYETALEQKTLRTLLGRCFTHAFSVAKRVRRETAIAEGTVSISSVACELASKIFGDLRGRRVLVLGAGEMAEAAARSLSKMGATLCIANRDKERAEQLAERSGGKAIDYAALHQEFHQADVVITSTSSPKFIVTPEMMRDAMRMRRGRPLFIVDISVPRNVDPRVGEMENVFVYDVDDLESVAEENLAQRQREAANAEAIVVEEVQVFETWRQSLGLTPTIVALREHFQNVADEELKRVLNRLGSLDHAQQKALEEMTQRVTKRLLHTPLSKLKEPESRRDTLELVAAARSLFALDADEELEDSKKHALELSPATANRDESK